MLVSATVSVGVVSAPFAAGRSAVPSGRAGGEAPALSSVSPPVIGPGARCGGSSPAALSGAGSSAASSSGHVGGSSSASGRSRQHGALPSGIVLSGIAVLPSVSSGRTRQHGRQHGGRLSSPPGRSRQHWGGERRRSFPGRSRQRRGLRSAPGRSRQHGERQSSPGRSRQHGRRRSSSAFSASISSRFPARDRSRFSWAHWASGIGGESAGVSEAEFGKGGENVLFPLFGGTCFVAAAFAASFFIISSFEAANCSPATSPDFELPAAANGSMRPSG